MEAFYYAADPHHALAEVARVLRPGGTFFCAVNYYEENEGSHAWQENIAIEMTRWSSEEYREAFRDAGLYVAEQDNVPDLEIEIPPEDAFPTDDWETREAMVERYRTLGTLLTVGVAP
jgi:SAM-dependent methyltransferase